MVKIEQTQIDSIITAINARAKKVAVTTTVDGLMSAADKVKLDGVASGANNYVLPVATSTTLGGVKASLSGTVLTITL